MELPQERAALFCSGVAEDQLTRPVFHALYKPLVYGLYMTPVGNELRAELIVFFCYCPQFVHEVTRVSLALLIQQWL